MILKIHCVGHLDNPEVEILYVTHKRCRVSRFHILLFARVIPIRLVSIARDKTVGATVDPSELLGPTR